MGRKSPGSSIVSKLQYPTFASRRAKLPGMLRNLAVSGTPNFFLEDLGLNFVRYRHELPRVRHIYRVPQPLQQSGTPHLVEHHRRRILGIRHLDPPSRIGRIGEDDMGLPLSLLSAPHVIAIAGITPHAPRH